MHIRPPRKLVQFGCIINYTLKIKKNIIFATKSRPPNYGIFLHYVTSNEQT